MTQKFIDGYPMRVEGFKESGWNGGGRVVSVEHVNRTQIKLSPRGARRLGALLFKEADKAEQAK